MHPAFSVIFFTTASGAGYGLLALMGLLGAAGVLPADRWFGLVGLGLAFGLFTGGLLSSTFHLGHPERAWRALTQWRSSWLSREGVASIITYIPAALFGIGWVFLADNQGFWAAMGVTAAAMAMVTIGCTAMIYGSLKTIQRWSNGFTLPGYLLLGLMSGAVWLSAVAHVFGEAGWAVKSLPVVLLVLAWGLKTAYWRFIDSSQSISTPNTALGMRTGAVDVVDWPHTQENYVLKEMGYKVARKHAVKLRTVAHAFGFALPLALSAIALYTGGALAGGAAVLAALSMSLGLVVERWLYFAEARHVVTLFYGAQAA